MLIEIDFNSDEAIYVQLCNQIIMGIATDQLLSLIHILAREALQWELLCWLQALQQAF